MVETLTNAEKHTLARKERARERDRKKGLILEQPLCSKCGWKGEAAAAYGAGCPKCGERITEDAKKKKTQAPHAESSAGL